MECVGHAWMNKATMTEFDKALEVLEEITGIHLEDDNAVLVKMRRWNWRSSVALLSAIGVWMFCWAMVCLVVLGLWKALDLLRQ